MVTVYSFGLGTRHIQLACMCGALTGLFLVRSSMGIAVLAMTDDERPDGPETYCWDKRTQGYILSSFFCGYAVMQVPGGLLAKRFGGKRVLLVALLVNAVLCICIPTVAYLGGWASVCMARFGMGLAQAVTFPSMHTMLGRWLPQHERTSYGGYVYAFPNLGIIISMPLAGVLSETVLGWKLIFYVSAAVLLAVAAAWARWAASCPAQHPLMTEAERMYIEKDMPYTCEEQPSVKVPWRYIVRCRGFWAILAAHQAFSISHIFFFVDMPTYLEKGLDISLQKSAWLSALPYVGMLLGSFFSAWLCGALLDRQLVSVKTCRRVFNSIGLYGTSVFLLLLVPARSSALAVGCLVALLTLQSFVSVGFVMNHLDLSPNFAGVMMSMSNAPANVCSFLTPLVASYVLRNDPTDLARWHVMFVAMAAWVAASNTAYLLQLRTDLQPWDDPEYVRREDKRREENEAVQAMLDE
ncbi:putative inorganic phosphate cotransporter [Plutella xylostella]|uniref:putative inorganic phosphate cotransporter n=1 Tax=Plutella xylostella TaxID=51655 RepID=UPI002032E278|nr:putative inorganic phosphate cotransporter [Plutella xylostella]